jgi:hypothetical protein
VYNLFIKELLTSLIVFEQGKNDFETVKCFESYFRRVNVT